MSYDIKFRKHVLEMKKEQKLSLRFVASRFGLSPNTVYLWSKRLSLMKRAFKPYKINEDALTKDVECYPDAYQYERAQRLGVSRQGISCALKSLAISYKKSPRYPKALPENDLNIAARLIL